MMKPLDGGGRVNTYLQVSAAMRPTYLQDEATRWGGEYLPPSICSVRPTMKLTSKYLQCETNDEATRWGW